MFTNREVVEVLCQFLGFLVESQNICQVMLVSLYWHAYFYSAFNFPEEFIDSLPVVDSAVVRVRRLWEAKELSLGVTFVAIQFVSALDAFFAHSSILALALRI